MATLAPADAKSSATARPMPTLPPVTMATRLSRSMGLLLSLTIDRLGGRRRAVGGSRLTPSPFRLRLRAQRAQNSFRRRGQLVDLHAGRIVDRVQNRRDGRHDPALADLLRAVWPVRFVALDDDRVDV